MNVTKMILLKWAEGAVEAVEEELVAEAPVEGGEVEAGYVFTSAY